MTHRTPSDLFPALLALLIIGAACSSNGGTAPDGLRSVNVSVTTVGDDFDQDGYTVTLGSDTRTVGSSGSVTFQDLPPGSYEVTLEGLAPNCSVDGQATWSVTVTEGEDASVSFDVVCLFDAAGETLEVIACPALALAVGEGTPLDEVSLTGVPSGLERPLWARMSWDGGPLVSQGLVLEDGAESTVMIPLHPSASAEGGDVTIRISDEEQTCPPLTFRILPLPSASGELTALADVIQDLLDQHSVLFGTTREELRGTPLSEMEPALVPLAVAHAMVDGEGGESLRSYADGAVADFTSEDLDLLERVVARTGLRADLEAELAAVLAGGAAAPAMVGGRLPGPAGVTAGVALECVTQTTLDAAALDECMTLARDKAQGAASEKTQQKAINALDGAAILGSRWLAKPISSLITVEKLYAEAVAGVLPSSFLSIDVSPNPPEFMEDQEGPGTWAPAQVMATSTGWNLENLAAELLAGRLGPSPKIPRLTLIQRKGLKSVSPELASAVWDAVAVENFFLGLMEEVVEKLTDLGVKELSDGSLAIPPREFGPVDVTDTEWSDARIVTGTSVVLTSHEQYDPRESGRSLLEVVTVVGKFGGTSIRTDQLPITVNQLEVTISPEEVTLEPGQDTTFTVTVVDSESPEMVEIDNPQGLQGSASISYDGGGKHTVSYAAPATPDADKPDLLTVRHTAETGARGFSQQERNSTAQINFGGIRITTRPGCIEPDGIPVKFEAKASYDDDTDPDLVWSASAGDIDETTGLFTPPTESQFVTITVVLADNPTVSDSIEVQIGGCSCQATINVGGKSNETLFLRFSLDADGTAVTAFDWRADGIGLATFGFGIDPANPESIPFGTIGEFDGRGGGTIMIDTYFGNPGNPEDQDWEPIPPLTVLVSENTGSVFAGTVSGPVWVKYSPDPANVLETLTMTFHIEEDPILSSETVKACEVTFQD